MNHRLEQAIFTGLCFAVAFAALAHGAVESWSILIFEFIAIGLLLLWVARVVSNKRLTIVIPNVAWPMAGWLVWGWVQSLDFAGRDGSRWSLSFDAEATRLALLPATCLWLMLLIAANVLNWGDWPSRLKSARLVAGFLVIFGLGLSVFGLLQHLTWNGKFYWLREPSVPPTSPFGPFVNHNNFAGFIEMIIPLALALALTRAVRPGMRKLSGLAAAVMSLAVILSLSRGGIISMTVSVAFMLVMGWRRARLSRHRHGLPTAPDAPNALNADEAAGFDAALFRWPLRPIRMALMVVAILGFSFWIGGDALTERLARGFSRAGSSPETFFENRGFIWRDTWTMIRSHPWAGVGLGAFATAYPAYSHHDDAQLRVGMAHNDYLQVAAEGGVAGVLAALCFLLLLGRAMAQSIGHSDPLLSALALGASGGVFALLIHSLFDFNLQLPSNALLFLLLAALLSHISTDAKQSSYSRQPNREPQAKA